MNIKKRSGKIEPFNRKRIERVLEKAFLSVNEPIDAIAYITDKVIETLTSTYDQDELEIESIQDVVEQILMSNAYYKVAKSFILYRQRRIVLRQPRVQDALNSYISDKKESDAHLEAIKDKLDLSKIKKPIRKKEVEPLACSIEDPDCEACQ